MSLTHVIPPLVPASCYSRVCSSPADVCEAHSSLPQWYLPPSQSHLPSSQSHLLSTFLTYSVRHWYSQMVSPQLPSNSKPTTPTSVHECMCRKALWYMCTLTIVSQTFLCKLLCTDEIFIYIMVSMYKYMYLYVTIHHWSIYNIEILSTLARGT